jgi:hypothetical protein
VLLDVSAGARQIVLIGTGEEATQDVLDATRTETRLNVTATPGVLAVSQRYLGAGIEYMFRGYVHVAFLLAIVLWAHRLRSVAKIIAAFTVAHTVTLSLTALDVVRVPDAVIEPLIAASVVCVAVENFISRRIDRRWRETFAFGLVHGLGVANAPFDLGLSKLALATALAAFNIGVGIGQVAVVFVVLPLLLGIDRVRSNARAVIVYPVAAIIAGLGASWLA